MSPPSPASIRRWLAAILACAFALRLGPPGSIGIDHFDEGVYAAAGESLAASVPNLSIDPGVIAYGPPLVAISIAVFEFLIGGPSDFAAVMPGILFGTLAAFLAWRLARLAFSTTTAIAAAALVATSGMAIAFSRSALTESVFMVTWLFAMLAGARFLNTPGPKGSLLLGLGVGLAQLAKYNGGMTGLIVAITALLDFLIVPRGTPRNFSLFRRRIVWGIVAAGIAAVIYAPWFQFVEAHGGYRALLRHHGGYVDGPGRWVANLRLQLAQGWVLQAQPIAVVCVAAMLIALRRSQGARAMPEELASIAGLAALPNAPLFAGLISTRRVWREGDTTARMIVVWLLTMTLTTPLYHPYARLWIPAHLASLLLAAHGVFGLTVRRHFLASPSGASPSRRFQHALKFVAYAGLTLWSVSPRAGPGMRELPNVWSDRTNLRAEIAGNVEKVRSASARGQAVHLLLNPAGRRALALELAGRPTGPGRLIVVESFEKWNAGNGPILVDLSLVEQGGIRSIIDVSRETGGQTTSGGDADRSRRGLITILDLAPGVALGDRMPATGIVWIDRR